MKDYQLRQYLVEDEPLKKFIRSYWILKIDQKPSKTPRLFPLPSPHIVIRLDGTPSYTNPFKKIILDRDHIFFSSTYVWNIDFSESTDIFGIELTTQGYYYLSSGDDTDRTNTIEPLEKLLPKLEKYITHNKNLMETQLISKLSKYFEENLRVYYNEPDLLLMDNVVKKLNDIDLTMGEIASSLDIGIRSLERKFRRYTGLTLKKYQTIIRFNLLLDDIYMNKDINWGDLAIKHGFFDQAHMTKKLKEYLGISPTSYLKVRDLLGDIFEIE